MLPDRFLKGLLVKNGKHFNYLFGFLLYVCYMSKNQKKKKDLWTLRKLYH